MKTEKIITNFIGSNDFNEKDFDFVLDFAFFGDFDFLLIYKR